MTPPPAERSVLLVIDVQNDYCDAAGAFGRAGRDLSHVQGAVLRLLPFVDAARGAGVPVVWVRTQHDHEAAVHNLRTYFGRVLDAATLEGYWTPAGRA